MSEELQPTSAHDDGEDSKVDAIAAFLLIAIVVVSAVFWISGQ